MPLIMLNPYQNVNPFVSSQGLVLAMDYDSTTWKDSVNPTRTFSTTGSEATQNTGRFINGTKSYRQVQAAAGRSGFLITPRTADLTFAGDFWFEMWAWTNGQGNTSFTGGDNWLIGYGRYASTGIGGIFLDDLKLTFGSANGATSVTYVAQSATAVTNNSWNHFAVGRKDGAVYLFVNGIMRASAAFTGTVGFDDNMGIGGFQDARITNGCYSGINGYIDRLRIYDTCLTTTNFTPLTSLYSA